MNYEYGVPKKSHKGLVAGIIIFIVVLVGIGGIFYYKLVNAKNSFEVLIDKAFDYLEANIQDSEQDSITGTFYVNLQLKSADVADTEIFNIFNKLDLSGTYGVDYDRNVMSFDFYSNYDEKDLLDFSVYTEYGKAYVYLSGLYDKYIETSIDDYSSLFERNQDDYKMIVSSVRDALMGSLKEEYFEVEKVTLDSVKVTKTTLNLSKENAEEFRDNFVGALLTDEQFLTSLAKLTDKDREELKSSLEETLVEEITGLDKLILYTKGTQFIKFEEVGDDYQFVVTEDDGKYEYKYYEASQLLYDGTVKVTEVDGEVTVVFSYDDKEEEVGFEIIVRSLVQKNGTVNAKDVTNSISSEKITEDDIMAIYSKLLENEGIVKIIDEISKLSNAEDEDYLNTQVGV